MGTRYLNALGEYEPSVTRNVSDNLFERHVKPIYLAAD